MTVKERVHRRVFRRPGGRRFRERREVDFDRRVRTHEPYGRTRVALAGDPFVRGAVTSASAFLACVAPLAVDLLHQNPRKDRRGRAKAQISK